jgi:RNA polymerase sigma-70 factor, ECF subfamily
MNTAMSLPTPIDPVDDDAPAAATTTRSSATTARLRTLVDGQYDFVGRSLRNVGVPEADVDDAAQQVFLVLARRLDDVVEGAERSFLFQVAVRVASRFRRGRARRREVQDDTIASEVHDPTAGPDVMAEQRRARALLDRILEEMEMDLRTVFVLYEIEEMTTPQIAALLEIPLGTAASRLRRAREDFEARARKFSKQTMGGAR